MDQAVDSPHWKMNEVHHVNSRPAVSQPRMLKPTAESGDANDPVEVES